MNTKKTEYEIRNFGNDTFCSSVKDLQDQLIKKYNNKSVAIHYTNIREMKMVKFVDVKNQRVYNTGLLFDFNSITDIIKKT